MSTAIWLPILVVVALVIAAGWYLSYTASRLDRLHAKVIGAWRTVETQLVRRAEAIVELANCGWLDAASSFLLASEAADVLELETDDPAQRTALENELAAATSTVLADADLDARAATEAGPLTLLATADRRIQLAASFHNDAVEEVVRMRRRRVVRMFRLAGHAALPAPIELHPCEPAVTLGAGPV